MLPIAREGYRFIALGAGLTAVAALAGFPVAATFAAGLTLYLASFFRDPERTPPAGEHLVLAPADGRIVAVAEVEDGRFLHAKAWKIGIFMSPFNVHVNRNPCSGTIERVHYQRGRYLRAYADEASRDNEQNAVVVRDRRGRLLCFVQIAGFLARRIVCYLREGMEIERGQRCGLIMFGSRVDVYLPLAAQPRVRVGERARAGETVLAEWV